MGRMQFSLAGSLSFSVFAFHSLKTFLFFPSHSNFDFFFIFKSNIKILTREQSDRCKYPLGQEWKSPILIYKCVRVIKN